MVIQACLLDFVPKISIISTFQPRNRYLKARVMKNEGYILHKLGLFHYTAPVSYNPWNPMTSMLIMF